VFVSADAKTAAGRLLSLLDGEAAAEGWRAEASRRLASGPGHDPGSDETPDGRLDPRSLAAALDAVLPERRTVVQDGGHFLGWAPMYWRIPRPQDLVMVGTAYQTIGLGLASAVGAARAVKDGRTLVLASGDGGFLMGLSDLESLIGVASSAVVVIYNDAAYGAEIHQYGFLEFLGMLGCEDRGSCPLGATGVAGVLASVLVGHYEDCGLELHRIGLAVHILALVLSFGTILVVDWLGLLWLLGKVEMHASGKLEAAAKPLIWGGLALLLVSGALIDPDLTSPVTVIKLVSVLILMLNGLSIAPAMHRLLALPPRTRFSELTPNCVFGS
jgi:hypothetical protein